jgi:Protein of unknown function (DUF3800)
MLVSGLLSVDATPGRLSASVEVVPFRVATWAATLPLVRVYVDETGDRGLPHGNASPIFGMSAVLVDEATEILACAALRQLRADFSTPSGRPLSWKADLKSHDRRMHAASLLSAIPGLKVVHVVADKSQLRDGTYRDDVTLFYNVVAYATLQRVLWAARAWPGGARRTEIRFGHVRKHDHTDTHRYFQIKQSQDRRVPLALISDLSWVNADRYEMSQAADVYAGFLKSAFWHQPVGRRGRRPPGPHVAPGQELLQLRHHTRTAGKAE